MFMNSSAIICIVICVGAIIGLALSNKKANDGFHDDNRGTDSDPGSKENE